VFFYLGTRIRLVIDATGDEFFMPDDDWFWWGDLPGETNRLMIANAEHSEATGIPTLLPGLIAFHQGLLMNSPRPVFSWSIDR
jgi:PhoPQ-activated pathogenicity-related protein